MTYDALHQAVLAQCENNVWQGSLPGLAAACNSNVQSLLVALEQMRQAGTINYMTVHLPTNATASSCRTSRPTFTST